MCIYIYILYIYIYTHLYIYINNNLTWLGHGMSWICGEIWKFLKDFTETTGLNGGDSHDRNNTGGTWRFAQVFLGESTKP